MRDQITRIKITEKNACLLESRRSCDEIPAIFTDSPFRFNRILSAEERGSFSYMLPRSPNGRISSIGESIFQDKKNFVLFVIMCTKDKL